LSKLDARPDQRNLTEGHQFCKYTAQGWSNFEIGIVVSRFMA